MISPAPPAEVVGAAAEMPAPRAIIGAIATDATTARRIFLFIVLTFYFCARPCAERVDMLVGVRDSFRKSGSPFCEHLQS